MTSDLTERRLRRRAAEQLFDEVADDYLNQPRVNRARIVRPGIDDHRLTMASMRVMTQ